MMFSFPRCCCLAMLLLFPASIACAVEPEKAVSLDVEFELLSDNQTKEPYQTFRLYDSAIRDGLTTVQRAETEAAFIAKFGKSRWILPLVLADVIKVQTKYELAFQGLDPAMKNLEMKWEFAPVSLSMTRDEAVNLQVGQVVYISGELVMDQEAVSHEPPTDVESIALTSTNTRPNTKARSHRIYLKDVKLTTK